MKNTQNSCRTCGADYNIDELLCRNCKGMLDGAGSHLVKKKKGSPINLSNVSFRYFLKNKSFLNNKFIVYLLIVAIIILIMMSVFTVPSIWRSKVFEFSPSSRQSPANRSPLSCPTEPLNTMGEDGIGVRCENGEYIGINDGRYLFYANPHTMDLMKEATKSLRNENLGNALTEWEAAHEKDTRDAEPLIYAENQRVLASKDSFPYITIVLGMTLTADRKGEFNRDTLQAGYLAQLACNTNPQLFGGKKLRLLIARSGRNSDSSKDIAKQIVVAAQHDPSVVGVAGWTNSITTLNAVKGLLPAHLPMVASDAATDELTGISPYVFRVGTPSKVNVNLGTTYIEKKLVPKRMVIFQDPHEPYSNGLTIELKRKFAKDRYPIASIEEFKTDDEVQLAQKVQKTLHDYNPDLIWITTKSVDDVATLLDTIPSNDARYTDLKVLAGAAGYGLVQTKDVRGYTRMIISSSAFPDQWRLLGLEDREPPFFKEHYQATYDPRGEHPGAYTYSRAPGTAMIDYDAVYAFLVASKNTGKQQPTREDIRNGLAQIDGKQPFQGITGTVAFGPDGDPMNKIRFILRVVNGGFLEIVAYQGCLVINPPCDNEVHFF